MSGRHEGRLRSGTRRSRVLPRAIIRGKAGNIIVVKTPNPLFTEAIFVLRDDIFARRELSREEILRQATAAAENYTLSAAPRYSHRQQMFFCLGLGIALGFGTGFIL